MSHRICASVNLCHTHTVDIDAAQRPLTSICHGLNHAILLSKYMSEQFRRLTVEDSRTEKNPCEKLSVIALKSGNQSPQQTQIDHSVNDFGYAKVTNPRMGNCDIKTLC